ncbi:MAG: CheR family methyltransferase [Acidobacteriota bacterium]
MARHANECDHGGGCRLDSAAKAHRGRTCEHGASSLLVGISGRTRRHGSGEDLFGVAIFYRCGFPPVQTGHGATPDCPPDGVAKRSARSQNIFWCSGKVQNKPWRWPKIFSFNITGFFRDPECLQALLKKVLSKLTGKQLARSAIRIWVAGCSTGEEVYSIAMLLMEELGDKFKQTRIQIFGTDIGQRSVEYARLIGRELRISANSGAAGAGGTRISLEVPLPSDL